jgi:hypothetical protein
LNSQPLQTTANHRKQPQTTANFPSAMPFDPAYPPTNALIESAPMRAQFNALNDDIQTRALSSQLAILLAQTSANSDSVALLSQVASGSYDQNQMQDLLNKMDELINALRR